MPQSVLATAIRLLTVCLIGLFASFASPIVLQTAAYYGALYCLLFFILAAFSSNVMGVKHFLSVLNGFVTGVPACAGAYLFIYSGSIAWAQLAAGLGLGFYCANLLLVTEKQLEKPALLVHHLVTVASLLLQMHFGLFGPISIGLMQEITNPIWFANIFLPRLYPGASAAFRAQLKTLTIYVFILMRFSIATPQYAWYTYLHSDQLSGAIMAVLWSYFTWVNVLSSSKLIRTSS